MKALLLSFLLTVSLLSFGQRQPVITANTTTTGIQPGLATMAYKNDSLWIIKPSGKTQVVTANFFNSMINSNLTISSKVGAGGALQNYVPYYSSAENVLYSTPMYHISGKIGVGTTNPSSAFHVDGVSTFTGAVNHTGLFTSIGNSTSAHLMMIGANTTNDIKTVNTQLRINAAGEGGSGIQLVGDNVGENVVLGNSNGSGNLAATNDLYLSGGEFGFIQMRNGDGSVPRLHIDADGKVGIGTISPIEKLTVDGNTRSNGAILSFKNGSNSLSNQFYFANLTNSRAYNWQLNGDESAADFWGFLDGVGWGRLMTISATGLVGIGTPSPATTLDVNGTMKITPVSAAVAEAYPPLEGRIVIVNTTNATFTSLGLWSYVGGTWVK